MPKNQQQPEVKAKAMFSKKEDVYSWKENKLSNALINFLDQEDVLPDSMGFTFNGDVFQFHTRSERKQFMFGLQSAWIACETEKRHPGAQPRKRAKADPAIMRQIDRLKQKSHRTILNILADGERHTRQEMQEETGLVEVTRRLREVKAILKKETTMLLVTSRAGKNHYYKLIIRKTKKDGDGYVHKEVPAQEKAVALMLSMMPEPPKP